MSFFDKVTKAVGDVVDRGKAEVGQFVRIQKINGEIGEMEKKIAEFKTQIQTATQQAGEKAVRGSDHWLRAADCRGTGGGGRQEEGDRSHQGRG